jgi:tRNA(His) guanylyltransferase
MPRGPRPGDDLAQLDKSWEGEHDSSLPADRPIVARLDGVAFRTYTRGLVKPFDHRPTSAMRSTMVDLVEKFSAATAYCCSDEITLVLNVAHAPASARHRPATPLYNNRVQKLASVLSSSATARFNYHMNSHEWHDVAAEVRAAIQQNAACFDARVFSVGGAAEAVQCIYWRHKLDCYRNVVSSYALHRFGTKQSMGWARTRCWPSWGRRRGLTSCGMPPPACCMAALQRRSSTTVMQLTLKRDGRCLPAGPG